MSLTTISTPDFGDSAQVEVIEVLVKAGDRVTADTAVLTLESDKATMEIPAGTEGVIDKLNVKIGDNVKTGDVLMTLKGETKASSEAPAAEAKRKLTEKAKAEPQNSVKAANETLRKEASSKSSKIEKPVEKNTNATVSHDDNNDGIHAGPAVRRIAREVGISLTQLTGTGPKGRILQTDVHDFVQKQMSLARVQEGNVALAPIPVIDFTKFGSCEDVALSRIKKISGKALQRNAMQIPHVTQFNDADITELEAFRVSHNGEAKGETQRLTILVFILKAVANALKAFPNFNASLDNSGEKLTLKKYFHIGVAVDTPDGLVVPVLRNVDQKSLSQLAQELTQLSKKARDKNLAPSDMQGGCFSISSLGGIGGTAFTPIINAPEVAILGLSKNALKPVWQHDQFVPRLMLPLSLSYDHRVIDGAEAARFIMYLSQLLADIRKLLL